MWPRPRPEAGPGPDQPRVITCKVPGEASVVAAMVVPCTLYLSSVQLASRRTSSTLAYKHIDYTMNDEDRRNEIITRTINKKQTRRRRPFTAGTRGGTGHGK
ncbi:hypothetical protein J6590_027040 [Homalodisca vitripennis]|nr:hypothetical protein J6590_027040 [Homalodisca vitripennis]